MTKGADTGRGGELGPFFPSDWRGQHHRANVELEATTPGLGHVQLLHLFPHPFISLLGQLSSPTQPILEASLWRPRPTLICVTLHSFRCLSASGIMLSSFRCTIHVCYIDNGIKSQQNRKDKISFKSGGGETFPRSYRAQPKCRGSQCPPLHKPLAGWPLVIWGLWASAPPINLHQEPRALESSRDLAWQEYDSKPTCFIPSLVSMRDEQPLFVELDSSQNPPTHLLSIPCHMEKSHHLIYAKLSFLNICKGVDC